MTDGSGAIRATFYEFRLEDRIPRTICRADKRIPDGSTPDLHKELKPHYSDFGRIDHVQFGLNYLIDFDNAVIVDVEATPARTYDEVAATKTVLEPHRGLLR